MPVAALLGAGERLRAAMDQTQAQGLAAAHIGDILPIVALRVAGAVRLLYNPRVAGVAQEQAAGPEGSVSMPGIEVLVSRPIWADIAYQTETGAGEAERLEGWPARIALHEIDQVNGIFFLDRISRLKREAALRRWRKLSRI